MRLLVNGCLRGLEGSVYKSCRIVLTLTLLKCLLGGRLNVKINFDDS